MVDDKPKLENASCWPFMHKWGKWQIYKVQFSDPETGKSCGDQTRQRRHCQVCNLAQDQWVRG